MTAVPSDPAFWRRFSTAVHLEEDHEPLTAAATPHRESSSTSSSTLAKHADPEKLETGNWLEHERAKQKRNRIMYPVFFISIIALIVLVILLIVWLSAHGWFMHGEKVTFP